MKKNFNIMESKLRSFFSEEDDYEFYVKTHALDKICRGSL